LTFQVLGVSYGYNVFRNEGVCMTQHLILGEIDITPLLKAKKQLDNALAVAQSPLEKTGAIKSFEFCYELAWKTMKRLLAQKGIETNNPRDTFRQAALNHFIASPEPWFEFIRRRNLSTHCYDEDLAEEVFEWLPQFRDTLAEFIDTIGSLS